MEGSLFVKMFFINPKIPIKKPPADLSDNNAGIPAVIGKVHIFWKGKTFNRCTIYLKFNAIG